MSQDHTVYDLGEIDRDRTRATFSPGLDPDRSQPGGGRSRGAGASRGGRGAAYRHAGGRVGPGLAGSLSVFVPGLGLLAIGETAWGLFYVAGCGFCLALLWAAVATLDRLLPMLELLDVPVQALSTALIALASAVVLLHLGGVVHAVRAGDEAESGSVPHPIVTGIASLLVPGWGQLLAGHRHRAVAFLGATWCIAISWLLVTPAAGQVLSRMGLALPTGLKDGWGPVILIAAPVVVWTVAIYDGAAGAAVERARGY